MFATCLFVERFVLLSRRNAEDFDPINARPTIPDAHHAAGRVARPMILLRRPVAADAAALAAAANHASVADAMLSLPHPYSIDDAVLWIRECREEATRDGYVVYEPSFGTIIGVAELREIDRVHRQAEVSFWLSPSTWGRGVAAVALAALVQIAFEVHALNRVYGYHMRRNPASGRVMAKCGFRQEGLLRERVWKSGVPEDVALWARLAGDRDA